MSKQIYQYVITGEADPTEVADIMKQFGERLAVAGPVRVRERKHAHSEPASPEHRRAAREVAAKAAAEQTRVDIEKRRGARRAEREARVAARAERVEKLQARRAEREQATVPSKVAE